MEFVTDPDLDRTYGTDLMDEIRASIHPTGDCVTCQRPLGDRPVRIKAYGPGRSMVSFVPTHAACGPSEDAGDLLFAPPMTWATAWLIRGIQDRDAFGQPVHRDLPMLALNPSVDVHGSHETSPGVWSRPIDMFHGLGFARAVDRHPARLPRLPHEAEVAWTDTELRIELGNTWLTSIDKRFLDAVDAFGGFLLAVSYRVTPQMLASDPVDAFDELVSPAGTSAFAWIPRKRITG